MSAGWRHHSGEMRSSEVRGSSGGDVVNVNGVREDAAGCVGEHGAGVRRWHTTHSLVLVARHLPLLQVHDVDAGV